MPDVCGGQKALNILELEKQYVGAENKTWAILQEQQILLTPEQSLWPLPITLLSE